jgi:hypothetical protein
MQQCAVRQFENELVERLSIPANRHLRPPAPERGPHSTYSTAHVLIERRREALDQRIESSIGYELRTDVYMETQ